MVGGDVDVVCSVVELFDIILGSDETTQTGSNIEQCAGWVQIGLVGCREGDFALGSNRQVGTSESLDVKTAV